MTTYKTILSNWKTDITGHLQKISDLARTNYPAYTIKLVDCYGVAFQYNSEDDINENFAGAKIWTHNFGMGSGISDKFLLLTSHIEEIKEEFSLLCQAFVDPGDNGKNREELESNPVAWWKKWKELLGNRNIDSRIYDVLGEMCALLYAVKKGENANWNGPFGASYDIETNIRFIEVKSTINRSKKEITISNQFQLYPEGKPLNLIFCSFERTVMSGISIDSILEEFSKENYDLDVLNDRLEILGFEKGMSARKTQFILHEMLLYTVDASFPHITPESFRGMHLPEAINKITYTVDISGLEAESLKK